MFISHVLLLGGDLTVSVFSQGNWAQSVKDGMDKADWNPINISEIN